MSVSRIFFLTFSNKPGLIVNIVIFLTLQCGTLAFKPILSQKEPEIILQPGDNYTVRCMSNQPVEWKYFDNDNYTSPIYSKVTTKNFERSDSDYKYNSVLYIHNVSYTDVKYYYCHNEETSYEDEENSSHFYLFVDDPNHLAVLDTDAMHLVQLMQHTTGILPCRPTAPDVKVELLDFVESEYEFQSYDQKVGFTVVDNEDLAEFSKCRFSKSANEEFLEFFITIKFKNEINRPVIKDLSNNHTIVGEALQLKCSIKHESSMDLNWILPNYLSHYNETSLKRDTDNVSYFKILTVYNVTKNDIGTYGCKVKDVHNLASNESIDVYIFGKDEGFVEVYEENDVYSIPVTAGTSEVKWIATVKAHPQPNVKWFKDGKGLSNPVKYQLTNSPQQTRYTLTIKDIEIIDRGNYTIQVSNKHDKKSLSFFLNVTDKPLVSIDSRIYHMLNESISIKCNVTGYPKPKVWWSFKTCPEESIKCLKRFEGDYYDHKGFLYFSSFNITASYSGNVTCHAENSHGSTSETKPFYVTDIRDGFNIWHSYETNGYNSNRPKDITIAVGDAVTLTCGASKYKNESTDLKWYKNSYHELQEIVLDGQHTIERSSTEYSKRISLLITNATQKETGVYICTFNKTLRNNENFRKIAVLVATPVAPQISSKLLENEDKVLDVYQREDFDLTCNVTGIPFPTVTWYRDGNDFSPYIDEKRIKLKDNNQILSFKTLNTTDAGKYECRASNKAGKRSKFVTLYFPTSVSNTILAFIVIACLFIILIVISISCFIIKRKEKKLRRELKLAGLDNFEEGDLECLNPQLGVDDQAELLPYDKKRWEFPREKLKLGKQLGSGAFGVVMKAEAHGIVEEEDKTTVAVKMVKRNADNTFIRALASELKIMVHLGQHLNVVNLLGACTNNVEKRELLVIVEYCRFGNLHNYLLRHRDNFINQIDECSGKIDFSIGGEILERSFSVSTHRSSDGGAAAAALNDMRDYRGNANYSGVTTYTDTTAICMTPTGAQGEDNFLTLSNNSQQPEWRSNYRGDYKGNVRPICTKDLITWSFQVARGMEYLASRKVLHGDLAARNILLTDNNVVKICDFGLAKSIYKNDNYKKSGDGPLPVKWMAVESIRDRVFSTQSDVWAFGIVLWEFFSLARTPYPGMEADERLYYKLVDGYRMDPPAYATTEMYNMMVDCWEAKPLLRPSFDALVKRLGSMLEESVKQHYIDLNDPYLVMNTQRLQDGCSDYLAMFSPPDFEVTTSPRYVNDLPYPESMEDPGSTGYMCMKPTSIFSPREIEEEIFVFDNNKKQPKNGEEGTTPELLPMLQLNQKDSDCEASLPNSPAPTGVSNPSYSIPPKVALAVSKNFDSEIKKSSDNYVNMPQNKSALKLEKCGEELAGDKNIVIEDETKERLSNGHNYVNSNSRDWERIAT